MSAHRLLVLPIHLRRGCGSGQFAHGLLEDKLIVYSIRINFIYNRVKMNHAQLRAFHAVAVAGSFSRAARQLNLTQPALSLQVRALERGNGLQLIRRGGSGAELTDAGRALFDLTRQMAELEISIERTLQSLRDVEAGELCLMADSPYVGMEVIGAFARRHPGVQLKVKFGNSTAAWEALLARRVDAVIVSNPKPDVRVTVMPFARQHLVVLVPRDHPLAGCRSVHLTRLAAERVIWREATSGTQRLTEATLAAAGLTLQTAMQLESREALREAVAQGLGIGFATDREIGWDERIQAIALADAAIVNIDTVSCLEADASRRSVAALLAVARDCARRNGLDDPASQ
jgi:aminoethylphosphonate catabolism LysR family transcriptional regulator